MFSDIFNNPIAKLIHTDSGKTLNENGAVQVSSVGLSDDKRKAAFIELFIKLVRDNNATNMVNDNVADILKYNDDSEITDAVDGLLRQMAMTRSFRISTGKGEKKQSQHLMLATYKHMPNLMNYIIPIASKEVGCWKDVVVMSEYCIDIGLYPELVKSIAVAHCKAITDGDYLASKWAPRENSFYKAVARYYVKHMFGNSKSSSYMKYRKMVQHNCSNGENFLLETAMSAGNWDYIGEMLPNLTALNHTKYKKAFDRHIKDQYSEYLMDVSTGKRKLNTTGLTVDGIVKTMLNGYAYHGCQFNHVLKENEIILMNLQWKKFEDDMVAILLADEDAYATFANQVTVVDRSGSMNEVSCAAVGIGLFTAKVIGRAGREKYGHEHIGFGDVVIRFSDNAEIITLTPSDNFNEYLLEYITKENAFKCGYSTNIMSVHETIVELTKATKIAQAPDLIILTDMQYNAVCDTMRIWDNTSHCIRSQHATVDDFYGKNEIVRGETRCWNLRGDTHSFETTGEHPGVVMIGGFNQGMLTLFIEGKNVAEASGKQRGEVSTWDTFKASQQQYNMATKWMTKGIDVIKDMPSLSDVEKQLINSIPDDYVSEWMEM
jgi:hypothetical protein